MFARSSSHRRFRATSSLIQAFVLITTLSIVPVALAQARNDSAPFEEVTVTLPFTITHNVLVANVLPNDGMELLILGHDEQQRRLLAVYSGDAGSGTAQQLNRILLPDSFLFFDLLEQPDNLPSGIVFLSSSAVHRYNAAENRFDKIADTGSIYLQAEPHFLTRKDFARDLNNDGHSDLMVADFRQLQLLLSNEAGDWIKQQLPIQADMRIFDNNPVYSDPRVFAVSSEGKSAELYHVHGTAIDAYRMQADGAFQTTADALKTGISFHSDEWWELQSIDGESPDQGNLQHRRLLDISDLNNDGVADLVFKHSRNSGVFEQRNDYEIHLGVSSPEGLRFNAIADSAVRSDSTQFDLRTRDLNNDGRADLTIPSLKLGVGQVISALLSGEVDLDYDFYIMGDNGQFRSKPDLNREVEMKFNLTSGRSGNPLVQVADFTGDRHMDLLVNRGDSRIALHAGNSDDSLFVKRPRLQRVQLPLDGNMTTAADINDDNKHDILLRYGREDGDGMMSMLTVLLAK